MLLLLARRLDCCRQSLALARVENATPTPTITQLRSLLACEELHRVSERLRGALAGLGQGSTAVRVTGRGRADPAVTMQREVR